MTKNEFLSLKEGQLITARNNKGTIIDIFHYNKWIELRHHCYCGEDYYYLSVSLQPKLVNVSLTTFDDIDEFYSRKSALFEKQLNDILALKKEI